MGGIGFGKAREVPIAIQKAMEHARKNMVMIELYKDTVYHPITMKYGSTKVIILPASQGTGIIAGSAMRAIFEVSGIKNIVAKCIGSTNPINVVRATMKGLIHIMSPDIISEKRNIPIRKSLIGRKPNHVCSIKGLGLKKINQEINILDNSCNRGLIKKISYLLKIEEKK